MMVFSKTIWKRESQDIVGSAKDHTQIPNKKMEDEDYGTFKDGNTLDTLIVECIMLYHDYCFIHMQTLMQTKLINIKHTIKKQIHSNNKQWNMVLKCYDYLVARNNMLQIKQSSLISHYSLVFMETSHTN